MAFINNGPLTNGIRGKVGDVIFQIVNGIQIVRAMPASIQDPNTPLQQIQRSAFAQAVQEWRDLNVEERELWNFYARLRGNRQTHKAARRVDHSPKPTNSTLYDGHNGVVAGKSHEADFNRMHDDTLPDPVDLPALPPYAKTKNIPPAHVGVVLAIGSEGAVWNPIPGQPNLDGLWWFYKEVKTRTNGSKARAWVQPPYPIHSQRITIDNPDDLNPWGPSVPVDYDGLMWAWKCQVGALTIPIVTRPVEPALNEVQIPYVWKSQLDFLDADFQDTKGSAVVRFYLRADTPEGVFRVWPTPELQLLPAP